MRPRTLWLASLVVVSLAAPALAQSETSRATVAPPGAVFEIMKAATGHTYRLNRYTGEVDQLIHPSGGNDPERAWRRMEVPGLQVPSPASQPRFQVWVWPFFDQTYLLDTDTGRTWYLTRESDNNTFIDVWRPVGGV